jgi:DNA-binding protein HU-beta
LITAVMGRVQATSGIGKRGKYNQKGQCSLNKTDLVSKVAAKANVTKKEAESVTSAVFESIQDALADGEQVSLIGFGTFGVTLRKERTGRNPQTGEEITIPAGKAPAFKAGKVLKAAVK